jgi:hypothetical protein
LLVSILLFGAGCGGGEVHTRILLTTQGESLRAIERDVPARPRSALHALLAGPTPRERDDGLTTELPATTELLAVSLRDGTARVYLRGPGLEQYQPNTVTFALRLAQIVYTLTELPRVERVRIYVNGDPWGFERYDGSLIAEYTRRNAPYVCEGRIWVGTPPEGCVRIS